MNLRASWVASALLKNYHFRSVQGRLAANQESGNRLGKAANISTPRRNTSAGDVRRRRLLIKRDARRRDAVFASALARANAIYRCQKWKHRVSVRDRAFTT